MSVSIETNQDIIYPRTELKQKQFVLCNECFWCASALNTRQFNIDKCPKCRNSISSMPLEDNDAYTYRYSSSRGVELDFGTIR
jgi:uncharacterized paraquat-inducible protein A